MAAKTLSQLESLALKKLPPFNTDAEMAILGAILCDELALFTAQEHFAPADFYHPRHDKIFAAMAQVIERGLALDLLTLRDELDRRKQLDDIGGSAYLMQIMDTVPTAANVESHAKIVHEKAVARRLLNASVETATLCYDDSLPASELAERSVNTFLSAVEQAGTQEMTPLKKLLPSFMERVSDLAEKVRVDPNYTPGISTGLKDLDALTGGWMDTDLTIVAARPAIGKTSFMLGRILHAAKLGIPCAVFSLEMSKDQLTMRLMSLASHVNLFSLRTGRNLSPNDWELITAAGEILHKLPIFLDDTSALTPAQLYAKTKRMIMTQGVKLVMVDYLQLMAAGVKKENRQQEVTYISGRLKGMAKELKLPVVALSQLSRKTEDRADARPQLSDLRESGSLEQDSDNVLFLHRQRHDMTTKAEIIVEKQRNGASGVVPVAFLSQYATFENAEIEEDEEVFK